MFNKMSRWYDVRIGLCRKCGFHLKWKLPDEIIFVNHLSQVNPFVIDWDIDDTRFYRSWCYSWILNSFYILPDRVWITVCYSFRCRRSSRRAWSSWGCRSCCTTGSLYFGDFCHSSPKCGINATVGSRWCTLRRFSNLSLDIISVYKL